MSFLVEPYFFRFLRTANVEIRCFSRNGGGSTADEFTFVANITQFVTEGTSSETSAVDRYETILRMAYLPGHYCEC